MRGDSDRTVFIYLHRQKKEPTRTIYTTSKSVRLTKSDVALSYDSTAVRTHRYCSSICNYDHHDGGSPTSMAQRLRYTHAPPPPPIPVFSTKDSCEQGDNRFINRALQKNIPCWYKQRTRRPVSGFDKLTRFFLTRIQNSRQISSSSVSYYKQNTHIKSKDRQTHTYYPFSRKTCVRIALYEVQHNSNNNNRYTTV